MKYLILCYLPLFMFSCYQADTADLIIHNATIYSCDDNFRVFDAMAVRDGKIIQLGPEREILNGYKCDNIIDAQTQAVFPGFHDGHAHLLNYAIGLSEVNLIGTNSFDEVLERVKRYAAENEIEWIKGRGWDQTLWEEDIFPDNTELNVLFPNQPVLIKRVDGHAALANAKALEIAGINSSTQIEGGLIEKKDGQLTGILLDNAIDSLTKHIPALSDELKLNYLKQAEYNLFQAGLTSVNDAGIDANDRELFMNWYANNELVIKSYAMLFPDSDNMRFATNQAVYKEGNLTIRSFKVIADGALGSRGACLIDPYTDAVHNHGFMLRDTQDLKEIALLAEEIGYQLNTHCIGDSANRTLLEIYASVIQNQPDHRWKIEHAQVVHPNDFDFFKSIRILPSVQPTHCTSDMRWAEDRIGSDRIKGAYAYKTLLNNAGKIVLGTDFPVEDISPLATFYAAITRMDKEGFPVGGFYPEELLSREEALKGMTIWPAFSNFEENEKGSLEVGKSADFIILTKDIMRIDPSEILNTYVVKTFLDGQMVFDGE